MGEYDVRADLYKKKVILSTISILKSKQIHNFNSFWTKLYHLEPSDHTVYNIDIFELHMKFSFLNEHYVICMYAL